MKKIICLLLALLLLPGLAGCAKAGTASGDVTPTPSDAAPEGAQPEKLEGETVWKPVLNEIYPVEAGYHVKLAARQGDCILFAAAKGETQFLALSRYTSDGQSARVESAETLSLSAPELEGLCRIYALTAGEDGCFYALFGEMPPVYLQDDELCRNEDFSGRYCLVRLAQDGGLLSCTPLQYQDEEGTTFSLLAADAEGRVFLSWQGGMDTSVYAVAEQGELRELPLGAAMLLNMTLCGGKLAVQSYAMEESETPCAWYWLDTDTGAMSMFSVQDSAVVCMCQTQGADGLIVSNDGERIGTVDPESGAYTPFVNWSYGEHSAKDCISVVALSEEVFLCTVQQSQCALLLSREALDLSGRSTVHAAAYCVYAAQNLVDAFNYENSDYYIELTEYDAEQLPRLMTQIAAGDAPDLVLSATSYEENLDTSSGAFADLYPFLDADAELGRDSFPAHLLEAISTRGELHEIWTSFEILTLSARRADVGDGKGLTVDDYRRILAESSTRTAMFEPFMSRENLLGWVCTAASGEFIDPQSGTCRFDDPAFAKLLEWCNDMGPDYFEGEVYTGPEVGPEQVLLFLEPLASLRRLPAIREYKGDCVFVGFPGAQGNGAYFDTTGLRASIPTAAANPDGAWAFIRSQLLLSAQLAGGESNGLPANLEALRRMATEAMGEEDYALLMDLVENTSSALGDGDKQLMEIIRTSANAYLAGDKSLEETVKLIQSRASIYLAEKFG